jgi:hypothetical protein
MLLTKPAAMLVSILHLGGREVVEELANPAGLVSSIEV